MLPFDISEIERLLGEDIAAGDLTTEALQIGEKRGAITFRARRSMTVAGIEIARDIMQRFGIAVHQRIKTGQTVAAEEILLKGEGTAEALHASWKISQTSVEILSGIATATRAVVDAVEAANPMVRVACTRKTFPGGRRLSQIAVQAGGATLHRAGLSETILVFAEHRAFLNEVSFTGLADRLHQAAPEKKIGIEVSTVESAQEAIAAKFDVIQLEKLMPAQVAEVVAMAHATLPTPLIAAAGGINAANAGAYVEAGAGLIVTSWPYTAPPTDVQVTIESYAEAL